MPLEGKRGRVDIHNCREPVPSRNGKGGCGNTAGCGNGKDHAEGICVYFAKQRPEDGGRECSFTWLIPAAGQIPSKRLPRKENIL